MCCEGGPTQHKWHFPVERELVDDVTRVRARVARENSDEQGRACLPASQAVAACVAVPVFQKSAMKFRTRRNTEVGLRLSRSSMSERFSLRRGSRCLSSRRNCRASEYETHPPCITVAHLDACEQTRTINILIYAFGPTGARKMPNSLNMVSRPGAGPS